MSTAIEIVVGSLYASHQVLRESVIDLTPEEYLVCPTEGAECPAWLLGHAVVADYEVLLKTGAFPSKLEWLSEDFAARFAARDDHGSVWPSKVDGLLASFTAYRSAIIRVAAKLTEATLDFPRCGVILPNNEASIPYTSMGTMLLALCSYTSMLVGELSAIRTSLGLPDRATWCFHRD